MFTRYKLLPQGRWLQASANPQQTPDIQPMLFYCWAGVTDSGTTVIQSWLEVSCFPGKATQQTRKICITFIQRRPNVFDVGPTLYKCYTNVLCFLGWEQLSLVRAIHCLSNFSLSVNQANTRRWTNVGLIWVSVALNSICSASCFSWERAYCSERAHTEVNFRLITVQGDIEAHTQRDIEAYIVTHLDILALS